MAGKPKRDNQTAPCWGGKRTNQPGRPPKDETDKATVGVSFRLRPDEAQAISAMFADGETLHSACKRLALGSLARHEKQQEPTNPPAKSANPQAQSANLQQCRSCGQMFDPWHKRKWCHICNEPLT